MNPLDAYEEAVERCESERTIENDLEACRRHADALGYWMRAPWWRRHLLERRFRRIMRRQVRAAGEDHRIWTWRARYGR